MQLRFWRLVTQLTNGDSSSAPNLVVLCAGMIRSGSRWSYNFVIDLLRGAGLPVIEGGYSESFADWVTGLPASAAGVIKCHLFDQDTIRALQSSGRATRCLFTYRGAGAAIASAIRAFALEFEPQAGAIAQALHTYEKAREAWDTLALNCERLDDSSTAAAVARFLGVPSPDHELESIHRRHRRSATARRLSSIDWNAKDAIYRDARYTFHRESLLHRTHSRQKPRRASDTICRPSELGFSMTWLRRTKPRDLLLAKISTRT